MLDFIIMSHKHIKKDVVHIYPKFVCKKSKDLMIRGGDFYAVWDDDRKKWTTDENDMIDMIDFETKKYYEEHKDDFPFCTVIAEYLWDAESGMIDKLHKFCQKQCRDNFETLDETIVWSNTEVSKNNFSSRSLTYPLIDTPISGYDTIMSTLYSDEERHKIEWCIGSIVSGDSKELQKFMVLYGSAGTGKSTVMNIIQMLFDGYYTVFDAKALGSANSSFALEPFKNNPLIGIQHDGDLSKIEDNTRLNSLVSHEMMTVNEKFKSQYSNTFKTFLFMGTNKPVKITDAKSGLLRRLIDASPSGEKLPKREYNNAMAKIPFELGGIALHCLSIYEEDPNYYDDYIPINMLGASNDFYNFVMDMSSKFMEADGISLKSAWELYKTYCDEVKMLYPFSQRVFKEELKNYFKEYKERHTLDDGTRVRNYYLYFISSKFDVPEETVKVLNKSHNPLDLKEQPSIFDEYCSGQPAQYATASHTPIEKWDNVQTTLSDIDTSRVHYVRPGAQHIVIDFDIVGKDGSKNLQKNIEMASKWPKTYTEVSKSGNGIHLHYIYDGDVDRLSAVFDEHVEIKVHHKKQGLRRRLSLCNDYPIATINSGLPLKGEKKMIDPNVVHTEKSLRALIKRCLLKEIHPDTTSNIDFICKLLNDAYDQGVVYDVSDMYNEIMVFACNSTNQANECLEKIGNIPFKSDTEKGNIENYEDSPIVFFDVEVFPNLFILNWKKRGSEFPIHHMVNPTAEQIEEFLSVKYKLVGFNNRLYDNHIVYAALMGYNNLEIYNLSKRIIGNVPNSMFREAYNLSYADIYDFVKDKKSLKKYEIELGLIHKELGMDWDIPVPENKWQEVSDYCDYDVLATEAVFEYKYGDFVARQILSDLSGLTINDKTNNHTTKIVFGNNKTPQGVFNYRNMGDETVKTKKGKFDGIFNVFDDKHRPIFPGYKYEFGKSTYRGIVVGEGGYVYAEPGIHTNVALIDVASMHPTSLIREILLGEEYTRRFEEIVQARLYIKHREFDKARNLLDGRLAKYLDDESLADSLADALKLAINSVYGLTCATFDHPFKDKRNIDNIVAKRGALFMINLQHEIQERGYTVVHIKTDSIKIADATPEIIDFVMEYGEEYGYSFEYEAHYEKMFLANDAVYVARYSQNDVNGSSNPKKDKRGKWTSTGAQFAVPYVFKTLFSHEPIEFKDYCETKNVAKGFIYLDNNEGMEDVSYYQNIKDGRRKQRKGVKITKKLEQLLEQTSSLSDEYIDEEIAKGHNYVFVGKVGQFTPVIRNTNGGELVKYNNDKFDSVTGASGYRWKESISLKELEMEDTVDLEYYINQVNNAIADIEKFGDAEWFIHGEADDHILEEYIESSSNDDMPCGESNITCLECSKCKIVDSENIKCDDGFELKPAFIDNKK